MLGTSQRAPTRPYLTLPDPICPYLPSLPQAALTSHRTDCQDARKNTAVCGTYDSYSCFGLGTRAANAEMSIDFSGTDSAGTFTRIFTQYQNYDTLCSQTPMLQYALTGTYALNGQSDCGGDCVYVSI